MASFLAALPDFAKKENPVRHKVIEIMHGGTLGARFAVDVWGWRNAALRWVVRAFDSAVHDEWKLRSFVGFRMLRAERRAPHKYCVKKVLIQSGNGSRLFEFSAGGIFGLGRYADDSFQSIERLGLAYQAPAARWIHVA